MKRAFETADAECEVVRNSIFLGRDMKSTRTKWKVVPWNWK